MTLAFLLLALAVPTPPAGAETWESTGPACARITSFAEGIRGSRALYVTTAERLFESRNDGARWTEILFDRPTRVLSIRTHPVLRGHLVAATNRGVLVSEDGGKTWSERNDGLSKPRVSRIEIAESDPHPLFAVSPGGGGDLYRFDPARQSWQTVGPNNEVQEISVHPRDSEVIWVATRSGVFRTANGGRRWRRIHRGLEGIRIKSLALDPTDAKTAYAIPDPRFEAHLPLYQTSNGRRWRVLATPPAGSRFDTVSVDPSRPTRLLAGLVWAPNGPLGIARSGDGGRSWRVVDLPREQIVLLERSRFRAKRVYAGTLAGLFRGNRNGRRFKTLDQEGINTATTSALAVRPPGAIGPDGSPLFAASGEACAGRRLFFRDEDATAWQSSRPDDNNLVFTAVAFNPADPEIVYAGLGQSLALSADGGRTWTEGEFDPASAEKVTDLAVDPDDPTRVYAAFFSRGLAISDDGGVSWELHSETPLGTRVLAVEIDPSDSSTVYIGGYGGVVVSSDRGSNWASLGLEAWAVHDLAIDPFAPERLYASCLDRNRCLFRGDRGQDGGASWVEVTGQPPDATTWWVVTDAFRQSTVYLGGSAGVFRSTDSGISFQPFDKGLEGVPVRALELSASGRLYAATLGRGVLSISVTD